MEELARILNGFVFSQIVAAISIILIILTFILSEVLGPFIHRYVLQEMGGKDDRFHIQNFLSDMDNCYTIQSYTTLAQNLLETIVFSIIFMIAIASLEVSQPQYRLVGSVLAVLVVLNLVFHYSRLTFLNAWCEIP